MKPLPMAAFMDHAANACGERVLKEYTIVFLSAK
jgi:hypothetical protein